MLITSRQYEKGIYSKRINSNFYNFSVVSITFAIVIAQTIGLQQSFVFYLTVIVSCLVAAMMHAKNMVLNQIRMILLKEVSESTRLEKLPEGKTALAHGFDEATL